ncbi:tubulin-specific chaperone cofactor E-like protein isoform X2 [Cyclopterus lumpus]|uniref:Tubulin folding cofactor E like n=2 Tax=Cyclopterus lumpus TaxID=8103 RepID=A0A8C2WQ90_CYCLU|nr:tubulin-specific chaperone cofactor E-like protein isoform X2 [Cyclopterus lumpus]XP_034403908.1 tubulin-specific chaperone cofactor E-like protein isoform X2 [Cyclopterus lumpus]XP_034403909.1 tubulin-specific chaperone cofactor E-like protein isoform X2 [Cyclopterus lumpus]XP_034403910.1 tubulin-specific chaperone cofactor E-like protein isoform X2 [Cyclopterus lumpus]XP_034403911.1 tubulin-specific chaperone cofactor E-like protein isoform X2 [Cyclopterus lumpus]
MEPPGESNGRSFVEVLSEKYSPDNFPLRRGPGMGVVVVPTAAPQGSPMKDRLNMPTILVLNSCGINRAGDQAEISAFCAHVIELDLSHNQLQDWREISKIVSNIPNLDFLNLSSNPLAGSRLEPRYAAGFSGVHHLVLNNTRVSWDTVLLLCREMTQLEELFLGLNEYREVASSGAACPTLRLLHVTDNSLQDWAQVRKIGPMFPGLDTLVMADNRLDSIQDHEDDLRRLFPKLRSINLSNSGLNRWEDVEKLNFFPKLEEVRLQGVPLLQSYTNAERRSLTVAQLPAISLLNGSVVTECEREDAERFFIRFHVDHPEEQLPRRYHSLVTKYGKLEPLVEIDLRPRYRALVEVHCEDKVEQLSIRLDQTVAELKKQLTAVVRRPSGGMRIYYIDKCGAFGPEEMKYNSRAVHSYSVQDGDQILVVPKTK